MTPQLTAFGAVFLPLLLIAAYRKASWFVALLAGSAVMQGTSVLNLDTATGSVGVPPYLAGGLAAGVLLLHRASRTSVGGVARDALERPAVCAWLVYLAVAAAGALVLPRLFSGLEVYSLIGLGGFDVPKETLAPGLSNYAQVVNTAVHAMVLVYLASTFRRGEWQPRHLLAGLGAGALFVAALGLHERIALLRGTPLLQPWLVNNPGYKLYALDDLGGIARVYAPFSEPSYASAYLGAVTVALFTHVLFGQRRRGWSLAGLVVSAVALANTLGATGAVTVTLGVVVMLVVASITVFLRPGRVAGLGACVAILWCILATGLVGAVVVSRMPDRFAAVHEVVASKLASDSVRNRRRSNAHALYLARETWGLGAGLGSNRASSFAASLLSNTGLPGMLAFLWALACVARAARGQWPDDARILATGALVGALISVSAGIPDLNIPFLWMFVFAATLILPAKNQEAMT